ncbi:MAG: cyclic nucleotide-binding domain-containing protein [Planctomycetes bacterium]|nr:cyclic nucleotide-binding domain-containing protein [Planctomycetota bacterium]
MSSASAGQVEALLATPLFAGVDDELLDGIRTEAAIADGSYAFEPGVARREGLVRFRDVADAEEIVAQGTITTEFVVILHGQVQALQARSGRDVYRHRDYGPGDWFGEVSTRSHHPALATYRADGDTLIAVIEARMFARLYAEDDTFRERIDQGYLDNLALHLRLSPLTRELDEQAIAALQKGAELVSYEDGDTIVERNEAADCVFLVRAGAVAAVVDSHGSERTLAFYKGNATFGEHALLGNGATWPATYKALTATTLIKLPKQAARNLSAPEQRGLVRAANRLLGKDEVAAATSANAEDIGSRRLLDELFVMVERESVKGGRALVIDRTRCVRCNMCVESCVAVHDDGIPRLSKVGTPVATDEVLITACYHCETPQCMLSCEYAAIRRDPQGRVRFEYDNCVGCAGCIDGCPYGVIRLVAPAPPPPPPPSFLQSLPLVGKLFGSPPAAPATAAAPARDDDAARMRSIGAGGKLNQVNGKTIKCDLCAGLPFEACVYNCPTTAILRKQPQELFDPATARRRGL